MSVSLDLGLISNRGEKFVGSTPTPLTWAGRIGSLAYRKIFSRLICPPTKYP